MAHFSVASGHFQAVVQGVIGDKYPCHFLSSRMLRFEEEDPTDTASVLTLRLCYLFAAGVWSLRNSLPADEKLVIERIDVFNLSFIWAAIVGQGR